jgi:hypothetical protein
VSEDATAVATPAVDRGLALVTTLAGEVGRCSPAPAPASVGTAATAPGRPERDDRRQQGPS